MKFNPQLRSNAKEDLIKIITRLMTTDYSYPYLTCINCDHFTEATEMCKQWNTRPPARVIAFGCEKYKDDDLIPF